MYKNRIIMKILQTFFVSVFYSDLMEIVLLT